MKSEMATVCEKMGVKATSKRGAPVNETFKESTGWMVTLQYKSRFVTVPYYLGKGHGRKHPKAADVLYCLISDANGVENASGFEDWCRDFGYDTDSRKAEATYKACKQIAVKVRRLLGRDFDTFASAEHWDPRGWPRGWPPFFCSRSENSLEEFSPPGPGPRGPSLA